MGEGISATRNPMHKRSEWEETHMSAVESEPWEFASLNELLEIASAMEREAIAGYIALSERMAAMARPDLAKVFDDLVLEETSHLDKVRAWTEASGALVAESKSYAPEPMFDDEGAGLVAPELLSAYRAFSIAVRNEERAFMFWTYVSAHAQQDEIRQAAERMAMEELGHVAKLRRERRKAFHKARDETSDPRHDLKSLEEALSRHLDVMAAKASGDVSGSMRNHSSAARTRMTSLGEHPFELESMLSQGGRAITESALPLSEYLLECYLELGDHSKNEQDTGRARSFAAQLISCIRSLREIDIAASAM